MTNQVTPEQQHHASVIDIMAAIHQMQSAGTVTPSVEPEHRLTKELDPEIQKAIDAFVAAKELKAYADAEKDRAEEQIRLALDGADIGTIDGREVVRLNRSHSTHLDRQLVKSGWPEAYESALRRTDYDYVAVR